MKKLVDKILKFGFMCAISPFLFVIGGFNTVFRFYKYVEDTNNNRIPKKYYY